MEGSDSSAGFNGGSCPYLYSSAGYYGNWHLLDNILGNAMGSLLQKQHLSTNLLHPNMFAMQASTKKYLAVPLL